MAVRPSLASERQALAHRWRSAVDVDPGISVVRAPASGVLVMRPYGHAAISSTA